MSIEELRAAARDRPADVDPRRALVAALLAAGQLDQARAEIADAIPPMAAAGRALDAVALAHLLLAFAPGDPVGTALLEQARGSWARPSLIVEPVEDDGTAIPLGQPAVAPGREVEHLERGPAELWLTRDDLARIPLFDGYSESTLDELLAHAELARYDTHEVITSPDAPSGRFHVLHRGSVRVVRDDGLGEPIELARMATGEFFGELELVTGRAPSARVIATTPVQALELDRAVLAIFTEIDPVLRDELRAICRARLLNQLLNTSVLFVDMDPGTREAWAQRFVPIELEEGQVLVREGEANTRLFVLVEGHLDVHRASGDHPDDEPVEIGPGDFFGFTSSVLETPVLVSVTATRPSRLLVLPEEDTAELVAGARDVARAARTGAFAVVGLSDPPPDGEPGTGE